MWHRLRSWVRGLGGHARVEQEMQDEMGLHVERAAERFMARGLSPDDARAAAMREFGNVPYLQELARDARGTRWLEEMQQDLRLAWRRMLRAPALATATILTIGLGLGAVTTIITAAQAAFIAPLPYADANRLVHLWESRVGTDERSPTSSPTLADWRAQIRSLGALEGYDGANLTVGLGPQVQMRTGAEVTAGFFRLLGVHLSAGHDFSDEEIAAFGGAIAIVSARLAHDATTPGPGESIAVNGRPYTVIGVLPEDFHFALLQGSDVFIPLGPERLERPDRLGRSINVVGRLAPDVSIAAAQAEVAAVTARLAAQYPDALAGRTAVAVPLREALLGNVRPILMSLLLAVVLLLGTMAANLALLMLASYTERAPALHLRAVLGATRGRVLRQLFVESLTPAAIGAVLAIVIGQLGTDALINVVPESVRATMPYLANARVDAGVVAVLATLTIAMVIASGVLPGVFTVGGRPLTSHGRTTLSRGDRRLRQGLVSVQLGLTVVLLVCTGLLIASFTNLLHRTLGFSDPTSLVSVRAPLSGPRYQEPVAQRQFYEELLSRSGALPGVRTAALINEVPGGGGGMTTFDPVDRQMPISEQPRALIRIVGGEYFATMGIPVEAGRGFDSHDRAESFPVVVVSASLARQLERDGPVVGRRVRFAAGDTAQWQVVGVVGDVQTTALDAVSPPVIYASHLQLDENRMTLVLRTSLSNEAVQDQIRPIVQSMDPGIPVYAVSRIDQQLESSAAVFSRRFPMILCGVFGLATLALALVALYAVCAHDVTTRRREFGIRIALGASPNRIHRQVFENGLRLGLAGVGGGVLIALVVTRAIRGLLFGVGSADWGVYGATALVVLMASVLATIGPAIRARATSPGIVMRQE